MIELEVCVERVDDALAAIEAGATRIELNCALQLDGLTPSLGACEALTRQCNQPVIAMLRPHAAGFIYSPTDSQIILRDCQLLLETGIAGIAFGSLTDCHELELELLTQVRRASAGRVLVMHRAFDQTRDVACGLEQLISCGVDRVLTSAGFPSAVLGAARLRELQCQADGRIEILPGGGVLLENAIALLRQTGCKQVHGSFKRIDERGALRPDLAQIAALRALLDQLD